MSGPRLLDLDQQLNTRLTRRAVVLGAAAGLGLVTLSGRLFWLQVVQGKKYRTLAENNRINVKILPPTRGQIVDRYGVPLADNTRNFRAVIIPEQARPLKETLQTLQEKLGLRDKDVDTILKEAQRAPSFAPIEVRDYLTWDQVAKIEVNLPDLPGVTIEEGSARLYPFAEGAAHVVGYVGAAAKEDIDEDPTLKMPGFKIGKSGMERALDARLRGRSGDKQIEVNVKGREVRELGRTEAVPGQRLALSLDAELQQQLQARLAQERSASAVLMDVHTGEVYALASHPSFDPNQFSRQLTTGLWQELLNDPAHPLTNKAVSGQYPPGSTFKMVTALAGLEAGVIDAGTQVFCPGHFQYGEMTFHCWKPEGHGTVDLGTALEQSCDVFFYDMANKVGIDKIAATARRLGLGDKLGIELAEEQSGLVPDRAWKRRRGRGAWLPGETINTAIGQGDILATPLQLAVMIARLVNGGRAVSPWLLGYADDRRLHDEATKELAIAPAHLKLILDGMARVVSSPSGTAYGSRLHMESGLSGVQMGGKTGTAQVRRITASMRAAGVKNEDLEWESRHHALFVGYAPVETPRYAIAVVVEHGIGGARTAAPIARDLMTIALKRNPAAAPIIPIKEAGDST